MAATPIPLELVGFSTKAIQIISGAQTIYAYSAANFNKYVVYLKFYDKLDVNVNPATDVPAYKITVPAAVSTGPGLAINDTVTVAFTTAISIRCTTVDQDNDLTSPATSPRLDLQLDTVSAGAGSGNVSATGTPATGQLALWTNSNTVQGTTTLPDANTAGLTGDVTKSAGNSTTALANIPAGTPVGGALLQTAITAPSSPGGGTAKVYIDSTSKMLAVKNDAGVVSHTVRSQTAPATNYVTGVADDGTLTVAQPSFTDLQGSAQSSQMPGLSGDVTVASGTTVAALTNIPNAAPAAGTILHSNIAAPSTPGSGTTSVYTDTTDKRLHDKNDAGTIGTTVVANTGAASNFLTAVSAAGVVSRAQPAFSDVSGNIAIAQINSGTAASNTTFLRGDNTWVAPPGGGNVSNTGTPTSGQLAAFTAAATVQGVTALPAANMPTLTGDVTTAGASLTTTLANIPSGVNANGNISFVGIAAPAAPAAGKTKIYLDSTSLNLSAKNASSTITHMVQTKAAVSSNFLTAINDAGAVTAAQPGFSDISGSLATGQLPAGTLTTVAVTKGGSNATYTVANTSPPINRIVLSPQLTATLAITLPPAANYGTTSGFVGIEIVDPIGTATNNFGVTLQRQGSDLVNGLTTAVALPRGLQYTLIRSDGVSNWTVTNYYATAFKDPTDPTKVVNVSVSGQTGGNNYTWSPATAGNSGSTITKTATAGQFFTAYDGATGNFTAGNVHVYDLATVVDDIQAGSITANAHTVIPSDGTCDSVRLSATITAPLTVTWPPAGNYTSGEVVRFYDASGTISSANTVTIIPSGSDTINGADSTAGIVLTEPFANRTLVSGGATGTWSASTYSPTATTFGFVNPLAEDTTNHKLTWNATPGAARQTAIATPVGNNALVVNNAAPGMEFDLIFVQPGGGGTTLTLPAGSTTPSNGLGLISVDSAANAVTRVHGTYLGLAGKSWLWESTQTYTAGSGTCANAGDIVGAFNGVANDQILANSSANKYRAAKVTAGASYTCCGCNLTLWKNGSPTGTLQAFIYSDSAGLPGTNLAASSTLDVSTITNASDTDANATPVGLSFSPTVAITSGTSYWMVLVVNPLGSGLSANNIHWAATGSAGGMSASAAGSTWSTATTTGTKGNFKLFHA